LGNEGFEAWADLDGSNTLMSRRLYDPEFGAPAGRQTSGGVVSWYGTDLQGSVRLVLDNSGTATATITYSAWGSITSGTLPDRYGYAMLQRDSVTLLSSGGNGTRETDNGKWYQEDPLGLRPDVNPRRYVGNSPTNFVDPSGLREWWERVLGVAVPVVGIGQAVAPDTTDFVVRNPVQATTTFAQGIAPVNAYATQYMNQVQSGRNPVAAIVNAHHAIEFQTIVHATTTLGRVYNNQLTSGENAATSAYVTALYSIASFTGVVDMYESNTGINVHTGDPIDDWTRVSQGFLGAGQFLATVAPLAPEVNLTGVVRPGVVAPGRHPVGSNRPGASQLLPDRFPSHNSSTGHRINVVGNNCFTAGTPLLTPDGERLIEAVCVGDLLLSRDQHDVNGEVEPKAVEEVFIRTAATVRLTAGGRTLETTAEHPFHVIGQGWRCTRELRVGDKLCSHDGQEVAVEAVDEIGEVRTVYNVRVADHHTYFVGARSWGFSIWVHNAEYVAVRGPDGLYRLVLENGGPLPAEVTNITGRTPLELAQNLGIQPGASALPLNLRPPDHAPLPHDVHGPLLPGQTQLAAPGAPKPAVRELQFKSIDEQAQWLSENIPDLSKAQAKLLLTEAQKPGRDSSVVFGGSRVRGNHGPGSDLDVGYGNLSKAQAQKINEKASELGPLKIDRTPIVPGFEAKSVPKITTPEEFFQRCGGVRGPGDPKAGQPIVPSGSITATPDGRIIIAPPGATLP
jgi:RHS repeat-associated protein